MKKANGSSSLWPALLLTVLVTACRESGSKHDSESQPPPTPATSHEALTLQSLRGGDRLDVRYETTGCFHYARYSLEFHGYEQPLVLVHKFWKGGERGDYLGILELTEDELKGLDAALQYYRRVPGQVCTTSESMELTWTVEGRTTTELLSDGSCSMKEAVPNAVTFGELALRVDH